jgi:hypothetical protein
LLSTQRVPWDKKIEKINKKKVPREAVEIKSQSVVEEEDCSVDWTFPLIYDTYPNEKVSFIRQVDFLGVDAILSQTFNQSSDEIYEAETTFLSKSEGVFVCSLGILMAYRKGEAQEKHGKSTWQVYMAKWCVGLSRQTSRYVNNEERHVYYEMWPCCNLEKERVE